MTASCAITFRGRLATMINTVAPLVSPLFSSTCASRDDCSCIRPKLQRVSFPSSSTDKRAVFSGHSRARAPKTSSAKLKYSGGSLGFIVEPSGRGRGSCPVQAAHTFCAVALFHVRGRGSCPVQLRWYPACHERNLHRA